MRLEARRRFCKHCSTRLTFWINWLGGLTYWCVTCDETNK